MNAYEIRRSIKRIVPGLYRAAILESGTALLHGSYIDHARNYAFQLGRLLEPNFSSNNSRELLQVLRRSTARNIQSAARRVGKFQVRLFMSDKRDRLIVYRYVFFRTKLLGLLITPADLFVCSFFITDACE